MDDSTCRNAIFFGSLGFSTINSMMVVKIVHSNLTESVLYPLKMECDGNALGSSVTCKGQVESHDMQSLLFPDANLTVVRNAEVAGRAECRRDSGN